MRYGSALNSDDILDTFERTILNQIHLYPKPCDKKSFNIAKNELSKRFGEEDEEKYADYVKRLCEMAKYDFKNIYRKRHFKKII